MSRRWVTAEVDAPASTLWSLLVDLDRWPAWGPSVRAARLDGAAGLEEGATGTVVTAVGIGLPFVVTAFDPGRSWSWRVAGVPATGHRVEPLGERRCRVGFSVPWPMAAYLPVCRVALGRLERLAAAGP